MEKIGIILFIYKNRDYLEINNFLKKINETMKKTKMTPEEQKEAKKRYDKTYYEKNKEKILAYQAEWRKINKPRKEKSGEKMYKFVKVDGKTETYQRIVWERHNGPIPEGFIIHHIDGDIENNDIKNLMCMNRKDHRKLHEETGVESNGKSYYGSAAKNWVENNREKWNEYQRNYKAERRHLMTEEDREKERQAVRKCYLSKHEEYKEYGRNYYYKNKEKVKAYQKKRYNEIVKVKNNQKKNEK